jgi:hypothetical protein
MTPRTPEEFAAAIEQIILTAREHGVTDDEMIVEMRGIIDGMDEGTK